MRSADSNDERLTHHFWNDRSVIKDICHLDTVRHVAPDVRKRLPHRIEVMELYKVGCCESCREQKLCRVFIAVSEGVKESFMVWNDSFGYYDSSSCTSGTSATSGICFSKQA